MDGFKKLSTTKNALEELQKLRVKKHKSDEIRAKMTPERRLCEEQLMKQREYAVIGDTEDGWLKTIELSLKRWAQFEELSKQDSHYRALIKRIKASNLDGKDVNFLRRLLLKNMEVSPEFVYRGGSMVSFICPNCLENTLLTAGNEYHHCSKCGQKLRQYSEVGFWGNTSIDKMAECEKCAEEIIAETSAASEHYVIGNTYNLVLTQITGGITEPLNEMETIKECTLVGKYRNTALFEYQTAAGDPIRVSLQYMDIKEAR